MTKKVVIASSTMPDAAEEPTQLFASFTKGSNAPAPAGERPDSPNVLNALGDFSRRMFSDTSTMLSTWGTQQPGETVAESLPAVELTPSAPAAPAPAPAVDIADPPVVLEEEAKRRRSAAEVNANFDFEGAPSAAEQDAGSSSAGSRRGSVARRFSTQTANVGRRASVAVAKAAGATAAAPKKAIRKASVATSAFAGEVLDEFDELTSGGENAILEKHKFDSKVDELVYEKMKKILEERKAEAQKAAATSDGPEA